jgi:hypothetical protein
MGPDSTFPRLRSHYGTPRRYRFGLAVMAGGSVIPASCPRWVGHTRSGSGSNGTTISVRGPLCTASRNVGPDVTAGLGNGKREGSDSCMAPSEPGHMASHILHHG